MSRGLTRVVLLLTSLAVADCTSPPAYQSQTYSSPDTQAPPPPIVEPTPAERAELDRASAKRAAKRELTEREATILQAEADRLAKIAEKERWARIAEQERERAKATELRRDTALVQCRYEVASNPMIYRGGVAYAKRDGKRTVRFVHAGEDVWQMIPSEPTIYSRL